MLLAGPSHWGWLVLGTAGGFLFYTRFYIQWIVSERKKRSVVPTIFWYQSSVGSVMLLIYAFMSQSPLGALSQSLNIVIYSRNLIHIWREKGVLTKQRRKLVQGSVILVVLVATALVARTWMREYQIQQAAPDAAEAWFWLFIGLIGQGLFACRLLIQWAATELARKSVVPTAFWHLSIMATSLTLLCYAHRREWIFAIGQCANILIYARNLWFIYRRPDTPVDLPG